MVKILHVPKDLKLWELWYIPYYGKCRILSINRMGLGFEFINPKFQTHTNRKAYIRFAFI